MCLLLLHKELTKLNIGLLSPNLCHSCSQLTRITRYVAKSDNGIEWKEVGTLMQEQVRMFLSYVIHIVHSI